jgi:hypothetical protein
MCVVITFNIIIFTNSVVEKISKSIDKMQFLMLDHAGVPQILDA